MSFDHTAYRREYRSRPGVREHEAVLRRRRAPKEKALRDERRAELHRLKLELGCSDCGYNEHAEALQFDHLPGTAKHREVASMTTGSWAAILAEIAKCEVVCANCHAVRTAERRT